MAKVLIIEDDDVLAQMYATRLKTEGHVVLTERNGEQGLFIAKNEKPDIILLDLMLPGMTGHQVLSQLRQSDVLPYTPIVVLSNLGSPQEEGEALKKGATKFLVKTRVTPSEVFNTITSLLPVK